MKPSTLQAARSLIVHLRLNWQLMLMPFFLWGFFLSGGATTYRFWWGLFVFHVLFYGGSTAYNSYYDQDEGPVGGLWEPPEATRSLLIFAWFIEILGLGIVWFLSWALFVLSLVMGTLSTLYSHPAVRLKGRPWTSLLTVSLGQGIGGAMAGWLCGQPDWTTLASTRAGLGLVISALVATGFYPLTQIYQREEDRRRGDITFAVRWGEGSFPFAIGCLLLAAALALLLMWRMDALGDGIVVALGIVAFSGLILGWWRSYDDSQVRQNFARVMRLGYVLSAAFTGFIAWHLIQRV